MSKEFTLTKEEFIQRTMQGEVFVKNDERYFYDKSKTSPFKCNSDTVYGKWFNFNGETLFTLETPKPIIERRWRWLKDSLNGFTPISNYYMSDKWVNENEQTESKLFSWYKKEDDYIDVEIPNENT